MAAYFLYLPLLLDLCIYHDITLTLVNMEWTHNLRVDLIRVLCVYTIGNLSFFYLSNLWVCWNDCFWFIYFSEKEKVFSVLFLFRKDKYMRFKRVTMESLSSKGKVYERFHALSSRWFDQLSTLYNFHSVGQLQRLFWYLS